MLWLLCCETDQKLSIAMWQFQNAPYKNDLWSEYLLDLSTFGTILLLFLLPMVWKTHNDPEHFLFLHSQLLHTWPLFHVLHIFAKALSNLFKDFLNHRSSDYRPSTHAKLCFFNVLWLLQPPIPPLFLFSICYTSNWRIFNPNLLNHYTHQRNESFILKLDSIALAAWKSNQIIHKPLLCELFYSWCLLSQHASTPFGCSICNYK